MRAMLSLEYSAVQQNDEIGHSILQMSELGPSWTMSRRPLMALLHEFIVSCFSSGRQFDQCLNSRKVVARSRARLVFKVGRTRWNFKSWEWLGRYRSEREKALWYCGSNPLLTILQSSLARSIKDLESTCRAIAAGPSGRWRGVVVRWMTFKLRWQKTPLVPQEGQEVHYLTSSNISYCMLIVYDKLSLLYTAYNSHHHRPAHRR
jgi:hypothetical protein